MLTVKQIYENAGMMMRFDRSYEKVRENIETLVMKKKLYKWYKRIYRCNIFNRESKGGR